MNCDEALHLLAYDAWASDQLESVLERSAPLPDPVVKLWGHVVASLESWLTRIEGRTVTAGTWWTPSSMADWKARRSRAQAQWTAYARKLDAREFAREVRFTNSAGQPCHDPVEAIVRHVVNHGTHHRAQIASLLRAAGVAPPQTDYIAWRREMQRSAGS